MREIERTLAAARSPELRESMRAALSPLSDALPAAFPPFVMDAYVALQIESDRGCVVLGGALLDELLKGLLVATMIEGSSTVKGLFEPGGALGENMARTKCAYALGLIGPIELRDFETVAQIRNKCAHVLEASTFDWNVVAKLVGNLRTGFEMQQVASVAKKLGAVTPVKIAPETVEQIGTLTDTGRRRFIASVSFLAGRLLRRAQDLRHASARDDSDLETFFRILSPAKK